MALLLCQNQSHNHISTPQTVFLLLKVGKRFRRKTQTFPTTRNTSWGIAGQRRHIVPPDPPDPNADLRISIGVSSQWNMPSKGRHPDGITIRCLLSSANSF
ncbi:hypothetical protein AMECASPLE_035963 [Ameca splendens]|uniref:Uncharacterized protein n=1 Tax=Ameca splendens TaxID=208324 RepID=A0ABV0XKR6_9TELE